MWNWTNFDVIFNLCCAIIGLREIDYYLFYGWIIYGYVKLWSGTWKWYYMWELDIYEKKSIKCEIMICDCLKHPTKYPSPRYDNRSLGPMKCTYMIWYELLGREYEAVGLSMVFPPLEQWCFPPSMFFLWVLVGCKDDWFAMNCMMI